MTFATIAAVAVSPRLQMDRAVRLAAWDLAVVQEAWGLADQAGLE